jgi:phytanoyl-CoA hydroxylase
MTGGVADQAQIDELVAAYERDGFVNGGEVLNESELSALDAEIEKLAESIVRGNGREDLTRTTQWGADHFQIQHVRRASAAFDAVTRSEPMLAIAAALSKTRLIQLWSDTVHYKAPLKGGVVNWHQDGPYYLGVRPVHRTISAWIALDDATEESGCMWMAPGSQRWGRNEAYLRRFKEQAGAATFAEVERPEHVPAEEWRGVTPCPVRRGEVHFHHPFMWHASSPNRSAGPRRAYSLFLLTGDARAGERNDVGLAPGEPMRRAEARWPIVYRA